MAGALRGGGMVDCEELGARVELLKALGNDAFEANMAISLIVAESYVCVCVEETKSSLLSACGEGAFFKQAAVRDTQTSN